VNRGKKTGASYGALFETFCFASSLPGNLLEGLSHQCQSGRMNDAEFQSFLRDELDKISDALADERSDDVRTICAEAHCQIEKIQKSVADELESQARREIEKRPRDDEDYDTSADEQSKCYEDEEEILERRAEADLVLTERYGFDFSDLIDDFKKVSWLPKDEATKVIESVKGKLQT
jgi:hypothetical protein